MSELCYTNKLALPLTSESSKYYSSKGGSQVEWYNRLHREDGELFLTC